MLIQLLLMVVEAIVGFVCLGLLARVLMQWARAPFRNPLGRFVIALTDPLLRPLRRTLPNSARFDAQALVLAWLFQFAYAALAFALIAGWPSVDAGGVGLLALLAVLETLRLILYVVVGAVLVAVLLSWVNPDAPIAPVFDALTRPLLAPLRRRLPPIGGVDISPLALLLLLQILLVLLGWARLGVRPYGGL